MQLEREKERFLRRGLGIAALSHDSIPILADFAARKGISYPLLADPRSEVIAAFGLLQPEYPDGHDWHGVPYPGTLVIDAEGRIVAKFFEEGYRARRTAASAFVLEGDAGVGARRLRTETFAVTRSSSDLTAVPGNRITLVLDFEMDPGQHAYAPGEHSYRGLALRLEPNPFVTEHETVLPASRPFHFAPLDETVPVFEGSFRVTKDVTFATGREIAAAIEAHPELTLRGTLEYQVCSEKRCHPPGKLPLSWTLTLQQLERERVTHKP